MYESQSSAPETQTEILERCVSALRMRMPDGWSLLSQGTNIYPSEKRADELLRVTGPDRAEALLVLEVKRVVEKRDLTPILAQLEAVTRYMPNSFPCVVARYLSASVREELRQRNVSYMDATGNIRILLSTPAMFIFDRGQDRDPWRGVGRPRGTLKGAPAAKVVRALIDFSKPFAIRELIDISGASTGATYRVVDYLEREDFISRETDGKIMAPDWRRLLEQWSKDYGFLRSNKVRSFIEPRGLGVLVAKASRLTNSNYAFTGTLAAERWAAYAPARSAMIYVENIDKAATEWNLRPTDAGANVLLAEPQTDVVFARSTIAESGATFAAPSQVAVDLMTGPGRGPAEAGELLDWMGRNERDWRN